MLALVLAMAMQQAAAAEVQVRVTVVRPACVVADAAGALRWRESVRPGPESLHCIRITSPDTPAPRLATAVRVVEGKEQETVEVDY